MYGRRLLLGRPLVVWLAAFVLLFGACAPITAPTPEASLAEPTAAQPEAEAVEEAVDDAADDTSVDDAEEIATVEPVEETPGDAGDITLVPHVDPMFGIESVRPEGWTDSGGGIFSRLDSQTDVTVIAQQSVQLTAESLLVALLPQLALTEAPDSTGTYATTALDWTLYAIDVDTGNLQLAVDMALAEGDGRTYLVLVQSSPEEYAALHESVFLPTLDEFRPLVPDVSADPAEPLPYEAEDVTFDNDEIMLAGTLTLPPGPGPHPAVVLVSGSGPQDRDSMLSPTIPIRPFALMADGLTRAGIAVLRYDDRGVGRSTGVFATASIPDFANDAEAAIRYLTTRPEIDADEIGLIGHSEGGMVAAMLGARNADLAFVIALAGPGVLGLDVLLLQNQLIFEAEGATEEELARQLDFVETLATPEVLGDPDAIEALAYPQVLWQLENLPPEEQARLGDLDALARESARQLAREYSMGWFESFIRYDPAPDWAQITLPVLAVYGGKDLQVDAEQNAPALEAALEAAGNEDYTIVILPDANHLFQAADTGSFSEYAELPAEFTPELLPTLIEWLHARVTVAETIEE